METNFYKKILDETEQKELEIVNDRPFLMSALKKVILSSIYHEGVLKPGEMPDVGNNFLLILANSTSDYTNEHLGADLKARVKACQLVELGFKEIVKFKKVEKSVPNDKNPGR